MNCAACNSPMLLTDIRLLTSPDPGADYPKGPVTGAVKVFACTAPACPRRHEPVEQRVGSGRYELQASP